MAAIRTVSITALQAQLRAGEISHRRLKLEGDSVSYAVPAQRGAPESTSRIEAAGVRRPAAGVTLAYLLVTLPLAVNAARGEAAAANLVLHCLALLGAAWAWRRDSRQRWLWSLVADWFPLLLVPFLYQELPTLMLGLGVNAPSGLTYHDALIQRWEQRMFAGQPARTLAGALPFPWLSELLHAGYLSYYAIIYFPPIALYLASRKNGRLDRFERCQLALMLAFTSCFVAFVIFPVEGPRYLWTGNVPDGPVRRIVLQVLAGGSARGTAFPSSHAAVSVAQAVTLWLLGSRRLSASVTLLTGLLLVGAVYGGFHYGVDMVLGALAGGAVALTARALWARRPREMSAT